jgi:DNA-binding NarL/FixJ family response regulator
MPKTDRDQRLRVLVSATSAESRARLEKVVLNAPFLDLAGSFRGGNVLATYIRDAQPDVILLERSREDLHLLEELRLPGSNGVSIPVVLLVDRPDAGWVVRVLRNSVKAILPRNAPADDILLAIQSVHLGLVLLDREPVETLLARFGSETLNAGEEFRDELTQREIEILRMLAEGLTNKQIASRLAISEHTVKFHISSILNKLGASSRTEAVTMGIKMGMVLL